MEFSPFNPIVKLCLHDMEMEDKGKHEDAVKTFLKGWGEAANDFERFLTAFFVAMLQKTTSDKLEWLERALQSALNINTEAITSDFPSLYSKCILFTYQCLSAE